MLKLSSLKPNLRRACFASAEIKSYKACSTLGICEYFLLERFRTIFLDQFVDNLWEWENSFGEEDICGLPIVLWKAR